MQGMGWTSRRRAWAGALLLFASTLANAAWPERAITLVVPYTPGTGIDVVARQLAARLPKVLGQPVVVDNAAGASGNIGTERVVRSAPDGYTFVVQASTLVMNKALYKSLAYDPLRDLEPVALTSWGTLLLVTNPGVQKVSTPAEMVAAARAQPGKLTYGTPGVGTPHHLAMAQLLQANGLDMLQVPFKGTAGAVTELLGGRLDFMFLPVHVALPHIQTGKLVALATGGDRRVPQLPQVPTLAEAGLSVGNVDIWYGVLAPRGTPRDIVARLDREIAAILSQPDVALAFETQGMTPAHQGPAAFAALMAREAERWAGVIRAGRISAE